MGPGWVCGKAIKDRKKESIRKILIYLSKSSGFLGGFRTSGFEFFSGRVPGLNPIRYSPYFIEVVVTSRENFEILAK